jgi:hypothetical protein
MVGYDPRNSNRTSRTESGCKQAIEGYPRALQTAEDRPTWLVSEHMWNTPTVTPTNAW